MDLEQILVDNREHGTEVEAIAHIVLVALRAGGADDEAIAAVTKIFDAHLGAVGENDSRGLAEVLEVRLHEIQQRDAFHDAVRLVGRLTMIEAHLAHDALAELGIASRLRHDSLPGAEFPEPPSQVELWVRRRDVERARDRLAELARKADQTTKCGACGEGNPANFDTCWNCGAPL